MSLARRVRTWTGGVGAWRKIGIALAAAALASGIATYLALTGAPPIGPRPVLVLALLQLDLVLLLALAALVAKRLVKVWAERRRGLAGSRLQVRLVGLFDELIERSVAALADSCFECFLGAREHAQAANRDFFVHLRRRFFGNGGRARNRGDH